MAKHLDYKTIYKFLQRYYSGTSPTTLGRELEQLGYKKNKDKISYIIFLWKYKYEKFGIEGLKRASKEYKPGRPKKDKDRFKNWTKEEMEKYITELEKLKDASNLSNREKCLFIRKCCKFISISKLCVALEIGRSTYYEWIAKGDFRKVKYDEVKMKIILDTFYRKNKVYGHRRISQEIMREHGISIHYNTVNKYLKIKGLKSILRASKYKRKIESKITNWSFPDLIKRDFVALRPHEKLYTDVSFVWTKTHWSYLSVVIDGFNNEPIGWSFGERNNVELVMKSLKMAFKKIDNPRNAIIHSDHGSQYFSNEIKAFKERIGFKQSMGRVGNSLDNRPAEYFFSFIKLEYLFDNLGDYLETSKLIKKIMYDYTNVRFQSCIKNMTPHEYVESYLEM